MSLLVTGSIGIDTVKTPFGVSKDCLGGSAVYFSMAASFFTSVRFLGAIGADCPFDLKKIFKGRPVDLNGLELRHTSKTFRWAGSYLGPMNEAITDFVELNVLAENPPQMPDEYKDSKFVFLANTAPILQIQLLDQLNRPKFVAADTMNLWINNNLADLKRLMKKIDCLILNETEARMLANEHNLITAAAKIEKLGPSVVVIKKGESGSIIHVSRASSPRKRGQDGRDTKLFVLPAYPATIVKDPTGAGDSFAGGFMGYLAGQNKTDFATLKKAVAYGTVVASFTIADFSLKGLTKTKRRDIDGRLNTLRKLVKF
ncbi:MAG: PfkB family carbohydrate kinase [Sedimentisphaerales bacterium]|jgi:sugar/nucleoside kinase (ribokinase family)